MRRILSLILIFCLVLPLAVLAKETATSTQESAIFFQVTDKSDSAQVNANNTETTYDYDADELYRLRQKLTVATSGPAGTELLDSAWNLSGNNGSDEEYQSIDSDALNGMESVTITYDLNGLCALGGDASAVIFDQDGWQYISLSDYGTNCYDGEQSVTIPLDDFDDLDPEEPLTGSLHSRFWYGSSFSVDIYSIKANPAGGTGTELSYDNNGKMISHSYKV